MRWIPCDIKRRSAITDVSDLLREAHEQTICSLCSSGEIGLLDHSSTRQGRVDTLLAHV